MTEQLWSDYSDKVCNFFKKRTGKHSLSCDLMQDTFHKVLANKEKLDRVNNREAWLFRIARNTLIDYTRKKKEASLDNIPLYGDRKEFPEDSSVLEEISECLYELIDEYEQEEQDILQEVFTKSLSQKEAAQVLDIPYSTFKSRVQKARGIILSEFEKRCGNLKYNDQNQIIGCTPISK